MNLAIGVILTVLAGVLAGNCMLPLKFLRRWEWENAWLVFTVVSLIVLPWGLAVALTDHLQSTYASLSWSQIAIPAAFGFGWGIAQVMFGLSVTRLGLALGYAVIIGLGALLGTLVPLFVQGRDAVNSAKLAMILSGVGVMIAGIVVSAWAGKRRESKQVSSGYAGALGLAVVCGFLAPMLNYSFAFGRDIAKAAAAAGNTEVRAAYAVWPIGLAGGFVPNFAYSLYLLTKNRTWDRFLPSAKEGWFALCMGVFWMGSMAVYGAAATFLGVLGTSVGWALFQIFMIMTANTSGMVTGEWKGTPPATRGLFWLGFGLLALATLIISMGNVSPKS